MSVKPTEGFLAPSKEELITMAFQLRNTIKYGALSMQNRYKDENASMEKWGNSVQEDCLQLHYAISAIRTHFAVMDAERNALQAQVTTLEQGMGDILVTLSVPAAEYVPAIGDAFDVIRSTMGDEWWKSQPGYFKVEKKEDENG